MAAINRIVFMGTPEFAVPSLKALLDNDENVVCVVTQPDRPKGRGRKVSPPPVKELARSAAIPVLQPERIKDDDFLSSLKKYEPDLIALTAYGRILPSDLINLPPLGTINVHGSLLPKYRGAAPVQWAVINGETETGITIMQMDAGIDTGDILLQEKIPLKQDDTAGTMAAKLAELGGAALAKAVDLLRRDRLTPVKQDDSQASPAPLLAKKDGLIDWSEPAARISCLIRGLDPWPSAYTTFAGKRLRLFSPEVIEASSCRNSCDEAGVVCSADRNGLLVATGNGGLLVREIQAEGARRMGVDDFIKGNPIQPGIVLGQ